MVLVSSAVFLLISCPVYLSITGRGVLKSSTIIDLSIFPFSSIRFYLVNMFYLLVSNGYHPVSVDVCVQLHLAFHSVI